MHRTSARRRIAAVGSLAAIGVAVATAATSPSSAQTPPSTTAPTTSTTTDTSPGAEISAAPTTNLHPGEVIVVSVQGRFGQVVTTTTAQICNGDRCSYRTPQGAGGPADGIVQFGGPGTFPFRAGIGEYADRDGRTFLCDRGHPCELRVTAQLAPSTQTTAVFPLTYAYDAPTSSTSTTVTTTPPTTKPRVLCAVRPLVPAWLWTLLVELFGVSC